MCWQGGYDPDSEDAMEHENIEAESVHKAARRYALKYDDGEERAIVYVQDGQTVHQVECLFQRKTDCTMKTTGSKIP